jgi:hypothetical protein
MKVAVIPRLTRDTLHHIFVDHHIVGHASECGEAHVDSPLTAGRDFVVVEPQQEIPSFSRSSTISLRDVLERIGRRYWKVTFLRAQLVARLGLIPPPAAQFASCASIS